LGVVVRLDGAIGFRMGLVMRMISKGLMMKNKFIRVEDKLLMVIYQNRDRVETEQKCFS
jgi:hypothetical protein